MARTRMGTKDEALDRRIGFTIYRERERLGLTILVLAKRAGIHHNTLQRVENGLGISVRVLCAIAKALGVATDDLVTKTPDIVHRTAEPLADAQKAAKVVCGTGRLFK